MVETITLFGRKVSVLGDWDTVVIGGGAAGFSAALSSAQSGLRTVIVEKSIRLGGTAVNALVTPMMPSWTGHRENFFAVEEKLQEIGVKTRDDLNSAYLWFSPEALSTAYETLYLNAQGHILYDTDVIDAVVEDSKIVAVLVKTVEGIGAIRAKYFVDASGDLVLARSINVATTHGDDQGNNQMSSLRFEMGGIDVERYRAYLVSLNDRFSKFNAGGDFYESAMVGGGDFVLEPLFKRGIEQGLLQTKDLRYYQTFTLPGKPGCMSFNCPHLAELKDNTSALARSCAVSEGHQMINRLVNFLQRMMPGFENSFLLQEASMLGIRESYRLVGQLVLTEDNYTNQSRFSDGIARGDWYIDVHSVTKGLFHQNTYKEGDYYEIPYRSMVTDEIANIIVAGRCISANFLMQASIRITPTCIDMGQAVGEAIVLAKQLGKPLNRLNGGLLKERMNYYQSVEEAKNHTA
ncbi:FAD-dependent oxidoreductase [Lacticaseibacillus hegangensis]|uniref:FAD-dependent oxidoreductase n=1 Tax=Lacticaseibacillus hegangensis TaxID=2486010 RepID=A0ABW4CX26_9LACO|nr:FAD-dependent oxidoreductase [Lacticaseibacillus hegangensis]